MAEKSVRELEKELADAMSAIAKRTWAKEELREMLSVLLSLYIEDTTHPSDAMKLMWADPVWRAGVVAGCSMLDGVILGADSRVTFQTQGTCRDTLQKLIFITYHTVLGFVGDITTAAHLLKSMRTAQGEQRNAVILRHWLGAGRLLTRSGNPATGDSTGGFPAVVGRGQHPILLVAGRYARRA